MMRPTLRAPRATWARRFLPLRAGEVALACCLLGAAAPGAPPPEPPLPQVVAHRLDNGFAVVVVPRPDLPLVAVNLSVGVGAFDDPDGSAGMAHLLEHVSLTGTARLGSRDPAREQRALADLDAADLALARELENPQADAARIADLTARSAALQAAAGRWAEPGEPHAEILERRGAIGLNAVTSWDSTQYFCRLPASLFPMWIELEADRLRHPLFRGLHREREAVLREIAAAPRLTAFELLVQRVFPGHARSLSPFGETEEVGSIARPAALDYFAARYHPERMALAVVGDVSPAAVIDLCEKVFGGWRPTAPAPPPAPPGPPAAGPRTLVLRSQRSPSVLVGFPRPEALPEREAAALAAIEEILNSRALSPLRAAGGAPGAVQARASAAFPGLRGPSILVVQAVGDGSISGDELLARIQAALDGISGMEDRDLAAGILLAERKLSEQIEDPARLASLLAEYQTVRGGWPRLFERFRAAHTLTPAEVRATAARHLSLRQETKP
jgi:predicted Zn-dependent peptidase